MAKDKAEEDRSAVENAGRDHLRRMQFIDALKAYLLVHKLERFTYIGLCWMSFVIWCGAVVWLVYEGKAGWKEIMGMTSSVGGVAGSAALVLNFMKRAFDSIKRM